MDLDFDKGNAHQPKGHAIIYFRARYEPDKVLATYAVTLPMRVDFAKYVPPFLVSHLASEPLKDLSAFSLPPIPEEVESHAYLEQLADMRSDDLVCAGSVSTSDLPEMMQLASEAVQAYSQLWADYMALTKPEVSAETEESGLGVDEVLYSLMNERDRLQELSKLISKLRFALETDDRALGEEVRHQISTVGRHLSPDYHVDKLLQAAGDDGPQGAALARLYLDRCYRLLEGDATTAGELEERIKALESSG